MVEEKVYYRYVGEYSQTQRHLEESRVDMTLSYVRRGQREPRAAVRRPKRGGLTKMVGFYREG